MLTGSDQQTHDFMAGLLTLFAVSWILYLVYRWLRRSRPEMAFGGPLAVAFGFRVIAAFAVSSTGVASTLRGGDEIGFFDQAKAFSHTPFLSTPWTDALTGKLYEFVFAGQIATLDSTQTILRISQAGIAVVGIALLATAVYELAGRRAAWITTWILAIEPASVFFSTLLHKEPLMMLAGGLVAFGGACMWKTAKLQYLWPITFGCLIAVATRPYAGWFLIAAGAAITLHTGIRSRSSEGARSLTAVALVIMLAAISAPTIWKASTHESLNTLQQSQNANAENNSNLKLEQVDFSTRGAVIVNLPQRIVDVVSRPYPWQVGNTSQQLGLLGTIFAWTIFFLLAREMWWARGHVLERAGPLIYTGFFLLIAYSLSAGNAGTAFRYRTHIVGMALCALIVLRELRIQRAEQAEPARVSGAPEAKPVRAPSLAGA
jgi:hypothetical protein